nr:MAG TPA: hypothetical protein [Caudoviricetes sp.]
MEMSVITEKSPSKKRRGKKKDYKFLNLRFIIRNS